METVLVFAAAQVILFATWRYAPRLIARFRSGGRMVECCGCGKELPVRRAVKFSEVYEHDSGGSAVTTEWHKKCAKKAGCLP